MKPIKDAIKQLECMVTNLMGEVQNGNGLAILNYVALDAAIQALQEKLERENGCACCNNHVPVKDFAKEYSIEVDDLEVSLWEDLKCLATIKINYCPMCGRRLEHIGEATNMVEGE